VIGSKRWLIGRRREAQLEEESESPGLIAAPEPPGIGGMGSRPALHAFLRPHP